MKNIHYRLFVALLVLLMTSCSDDLGGGEGRQEGRIYFNVSEGQAWSDNDATRSGAEAPILMQSSIEGQPIYLHTQVTPNVRVSKDTEEIQTRGNRLTGDVFDTDITQVGIYGRTSGGATLFNLNTQLEARPTGHTTESSSPHQWYVQDQDLVDGLSWAQDGGTGNFYAIAPYFDNSSNDNGLSVALNASNQPVITYTVPTDVTKQLDLLTAKHLNVTRGNDIELPFDHVLSAIKFVMKPSKDVNNTSKTGFDTFRWSDGILKYDVTVNTISIENVYKQGTWIVGGDITSNDDADKWHYSTAASNIGSFSFQPTTYQLSGSDDIPLNADDSGKVLMMIPQTVPDNAQIKIDCTLTPVTSGATKTLTLYAPLKTTNQGVKENIKWERGYTYTYNLSLSDIAYVFDFNTATSFTENNAPTGGKDFDIADNTNGAGFVVRSYKVDANGYKTAVDWKIQHQEMVNSVTGSSTSSSDIVWVAGSNGWVRLIDNDGNGNEVTGTHAGAYWDTNTNQPSVYGNWYYQLRIGSIMTPVIDLSLWNYDQTRRWTGRTTANCYIVAGPGTYRIPLIYGNACTNDKLIDTAWNPGVSGSYVLSTFLNSNNVAITDPLINLDNGITVDNACLVWEEGDGTGYTNTGGNGSNTGTVISVNSSIERESYTYKDNNDNEVVKTTEYLKFEISPDDFNYGNAVVGIRNSSGQILWSWHIWMTDPSAFTTNQTVDLGDSHSVDLAGRNIGWVDGGVSVPQKTRTGNIRLVQDETDDRITIDVTQIKCNAFTTYFTNVLYQWGRKDPMRGNVRFDDDNTDDGAPRGVAGVKAWANRYRTITGTSSTEGQRTIGQLIQEPNIIYGVARGDLYQTVYYNLWAANLTQSHQSMWGTWQVLGKTIYDPSPVGYIVPPSRYLMTFARNEYRGGFEEKYRNDQLPIICHFSNAYGNAVFYASGVRSTTNSRQAKAAGFRSPGPALLFQAALGEYHTSTPYSRDETYQLHLYFYGGDAIGDADEIDTHNKILGDMAEALSVMPMVYHFEQNLEEQEESNEDPQQDKNNSAYPYESLSKRNNSLW